MAIRNVERHTIEMKTLHPSHYENLHNESGLTDDTILGMGVYTVLPSELSKLGLPPKVNSALAIPYPGTDFIRYRCHYAAGDNGPKYWQPKGTDNRLYFPPGIDANKLNDITLPLYLPEGEKKAAMAIQEGLLSCGLPGMWNWTNGNGELLDDFNTITLDCRQVFIVPDNDWRSPDRHGYRKNLQTAVYRLAHKLLERGAKVSIVILPPGQAKGLDDYLCGHSTDGLKALPAIEITPVMDRVDSVTEEDVDDFLREVVAVESGAKKQIIINKLVKRFKLSKKKWLQEIQGKPRESESSKAGKVYNAIFDGLIDCAINDKNEVVYVVAINNSIVIRDSHETDNGKFYPPDRENIPYTLSHASEILKHYQKDDRALFRDIFSYLKKFSYLPDPYFVLLTCKVFLSYIQDHPGIHYMPMILFYAVPERGKSRTGKAMPSICYRAIHLVDLREANIFRFSEYYGATLYFDLMNLWEKAKHNECEDILLCRFEKGAKVFRVLNKDKGAYQDQSKFTAYGPTLMSTNEPLHKILDTRCLPVIPPNKPGRYTDSLPAVAQTLRERLLAWRAKAMFMQLPEIDDVEELSGRLWDISKPLLQVCKLTTCQGVYETLKKLLIEISHQRREDRAQMVEGRIVAFIKEFSEEKIEQWEIQTSEVLDKLNETRPEHQKLTAQYLGKKLRAMGIKTRISHGRSHICMEEETLKTLLVQFYVSEDTGGNSPNSPNPENRKAEPFCAGESAGESGESAQETHKEQNLYQQAFDGNGESGERPKGCEKMKIKTFVKHN